MDEEEVVVVVLRQIPLELLGNRLRPLNLRHADELRQTLVHRIHRETRRLEFVAVLERRNLRLMRNAAQQKAIRLRMLGEQRQRHFVKLRDRLGRLLLPG